MSENEENNLEATVVRDCSVVDYKEKCKMAVIKLKFFKSWISWFYHYHKKLFCFEYTFPTITNTLWQLLLL